MSSSSSTYWSTVTSQSTCAATSHVNIKRWCKAKKGITPEAAAKAEEADFAGPIKEDGDRGEAGIQLRVLVVLASRRRFEILECGPDDASREARGDL